MGELETFETWSDRERRRAQWERLAAKLPELRRTNPFYRAKLPERASGLGDLPFTTKSELSEDQAARPPFGTNLTYPIGRYVRLHQRRGSTWRGRLYGCPSTRGSPAPRSPRRESGSRQSLVLKCSTTPARPRSVPTASRVPRVTASTSTRPSSSPKYSTCGPARRGRKAKASSCSRTSVGGACPSFAIARAIA